MSDQTFTVNIDANKIPVGIDKDGKAILSPEGDRLPKDLWFKDLDLSDLTEFNAIAARRKVAKISYLQYMAIWYRDCAEALISGVSVQDKPAKIDNKILNLLIKKFGGDKEKAQLAYDAMMG